MMMPLMTAAGWAAQLHSCTTVGLPAVALPNFRHSAAQRQNETLHNGTTVHIPKAHPGRAGGTQQQHAVGAEPAPGADTHVSSLPLANFKINKGGEAEAGKWWKKKVKVERESMQRLTVSLLSVFFGQILPMSWLAMRKQQT